MKKKIIDKLNSYEKEELELFYNKLYLKCAGNVEKCDYVNHIYTYLRIYLRIHKINPKVIIKIRAILSLLEFSLEGGEIVD